MTHATDETRDTAEANTWLKRYYFARAAFSIVWVVAAFGVADGPIPIVAALLLVYPAWDAIANLADAQRNSALRYNPTQTINFVVSAVTTIAVAVGLTQSVNAALAVFGLWASLSGLLQLATGVRRWKSNRAQWPMLISGVQSTAAGVMFVLQSKAPEPPHITVIAPYAAFGAFYFLLAAIWLTIPEARKPRP